MNKQLLFSFIFFVMGLYLLDVGITGLVVSETCCFPPDCPEENRCDVVNPEVEQASLLYKFPITTLVGIGLVLTAFLVLKSHHKVNKGED